MTNHHLLFGGIVTGVVLTLLYAIEGYFTGIFSGAPSQPMAKLLGSSWPFWLIVANLVVGFLLTWLYTIFGRGVRGTRGQRGMKYGLGVWAVATVFYPPLLYLNVTLPGWLMGGWVVGSFVNLLILGYVLGLLVDVKE